MSQCKLCEDLVCCPEHCCDWDSCDCMDCEECGNQQVQNLSRNSSQNNIPSASIIQDNAQIINFAKLQQQQKQQEEVKIQKQKKKQSENDLQVAAGRGIFGIRALRKKKNAKDEDI